MTTYIITRNCCTGVNEYRYFQETRQIGMAQAFVLPGFPVSLHVNRQAFTCRRDPNLSRVPEKLMVFYGDCDRIFAQITRSKPGHYQLHSLFGDLEVTYKEGIYVFVRNNSCIAGLAPVQKGSPFALAHPQWIAPDRELYMAMMTAESLCDELALLLLSFPLLRPDL